VDNPQISVIIAAYNCEAYIQSCVHSVTEQSFTDFELIVCDDGSTDRTSPILHALAQDDSRIRLIQNGENQGLPSSLNKCIEASRGTYLARLDADDAALPNRLKIQHQRMSSNPGLVLTGSNVLHVGADRKTIGRSDVLLHDSDLRAQCFFQNPFVHPTVMVRRDVVMKEGLRYRLAFQTTQDWDLWIRLMNFGRIENVPDVLVHQTIHDASISKNKRALQVENSIKLQMEQATRSLSTVFSPLEYKTLNHAFLAGRKEAKTHGINRVNSCLLALKVFFSVIEKCGNGELHDFYAWFLKRCLIIGLYPPFDRKTFHLIFACAKPCDYYVSGVIRRKKRVNQR